MENSWPFDSRATQEYTKVRQTFVGELLADLRKGTSLRTALDVGCGVGHFSKFLTEQGFRVVGVDGREGNVTEGRVRHPEVTFLTRDAEDPALAELGTFDLVLCVGLLYHLENPFRAIRNLHSLTGKLLFVEAMCAPGTDPSMKLVDEHAGEDQGLNCVAFYPTEACLAKMLYRAGFRFVYGFDELPEHPLFHASWWRRKERSMLLATRDKVSRTGLRLIADEHASWEMLATSRERWKIRFDRMTGLVRKLAQLASRPQNTKKA